MDQKPDKQNTLARLALCVLLAAGLYAALDKFGGNLPQLAPHRPWLAEHKVQAIAVAAAALFGVSLLLFPLDEEALQAPPPEPEPDEPCGPYAEYERACDLP